MTENKGLWRHHVKIEARLHAEAEGIRQELDEKIQRMRDTIRSAAKDSSAAPHSDSGRPRLVLVSSRKPVDVAGVLYWSRDGIVACADHAPRPADPSHRLEDWRQVTHGRWYLQCQICHGTPIRPATREARFRQ